MRIVLQPSGACLELLPGNASSMAPGGLATTVRRAAATATAISARRCWWRAGTPERRVRDHGELFTCLAEPLEDCVLHWDGVLAPGELPLRKLTCQLSFCEEVGGDVYRVGLRAPAGKPPRYHAGQYLLLERDGGDSAAFSWPPRRMRDATLSCTSWPRKTVPSR